VPGGITRALTVVGIGASAGGLQACTRLVEALPPQTGMAFILVQHLDPAHDSMMADLLRDHTILTVVEAAHGMRLAPEHLYVIPPGADLTVGEGALRLTRPSSRRGTRTTFDILLASIATEYGSRAACVVLSGTGADGSVGLLAIKQGDGLVIAQDPADADYDGMPSAAIATGGVDRVLAARDIAEALVEFHDDSRQAGLPAIIDLLRETTAHDFTAYKPGTLQRRTEQRMAVLGIADDHAYLDHLRNDAEERQHLARGLLINVTRFFRDPGTFALLAETIVPELLRRHDTSQPFRIWVAGCSTGEETYSLAMLFREQIDACGRDVKLQVFASDVDPDAVARARAGVYPPAIADDVSPTRLARFFSRAEAAYRVCPELRALVVFTVQDLLSDPPFSRLDFVSCRNVLIYLGPEAQAKVISLFHFALREGGVLLLGSAETVAAQDVRFTVMSKVGRVFRHVGKRRPGDLRLAMGDGRVPAPAVNRPAAPRPLVLAELLRRLVIERHAPAAVLVNRQLECLFTLGPVDLFLRVGPGPTTSDVLSMARHGLRAKLRAAIRLAVHGDRRVVVEAARTLDGARSVPLRVEVEPVRHEGEDLLLICFVDQQGDHGLRAPQADAGVPPDQLTATRDELQHALRELEVSTEEQRASQEEALSASEEYQTNNEELLTSRRSCNP